MKERLYFKYIFKKSHTIIHSTGTITTTTDGNAINYDVTTQTINRCSNQHEPKWRKRETEIESWNYFPLIKYIKRKVDKTSALAAKCN